jgi:hypothetical protein
MDKEGIAMSQINQHHKKTRIIAVAALVAGVLGLGVAFAALSTTLLINGTTKIKSASWDIHWDDLKCTPSGEAAVVSANDATAITKTTNDKDTVKVSAEFKAKGDKVVCTMNAVNGGTINAKLDGFASSLTSLSTINVTPELKVAGVVPADGRPLNAGASETYTLTLTYTGAPVSTDSADQTFTYTLPYVQANQ